MRRCYKCGAKMETNYIVCPKCEREIERRRRMTRDDAISINSMVETIATKVTEDTEKFIFETITPYCEKITKREISKKDLERALTQYFSKESCDEPTHYGDSTEKCKSCEYKRNTCDDAISREAVLKIIDKWYENKSDIEDLIILITYMSSVTQKSGKWIDYSDEGYVECPFCEHATTCEDNIDELHYCFFCGAKMVEPQESEDKE